MRTLANFRVFWTSQADNCDFPLVKAGISSLAEWMPTASPIVNPLSANTVSPGTRLFKMPQDSVRRLSLVRPPQPSEMKVTAPRALQRNALATETPRRVIFAALVKPF